MDNKMLDLPVITDEQIAKIFAKYIGQSVLLMEGDINPRKLLGVTTEGKCLYLDDNEKETWSPVGKFLLVLKPMEENKKTFPEQVLISKGYATEEFIEVDNPENWKTPFELKIAVSAESQK